MKEKPSDDVFSYILEHLEDSSDVGVRELAKRWYNGKEKEMTTKGDDSAFPSEYSSMPKRYGLTKREEFAKAALQGLLASGRLADAEKIAVRFADALIEKLNIEK